MSGYMAHLVPRTPSGRYPAPDRFGKEDGWYRNHSSYSCRTRRYFDDKYHYHRKNRRQENKREGEPLGKKRKHVILNESKEYSFEELEYG